MKPSIHTDIVDLTVVIYGELWECSIRGKHYWELMYSKLVGLLIIDLN